jgi:GrpB-like predicted nucleotidyltransferase (UPF0157 family)
MEEQIHLELYDPNWKNKFNLEREVIEKQLEPWINSGIHHVGSTAIPNMTSKPIIDIMVGVKNLTEAKKCIPILEKINYNYFPYKIALHYL